MGIIQALDYQVRKPNAAQVAMQHIVGTRPGAWFFARTLHHIDRALLRLSRGLADPGGPNALVAAAAGRKRSPT